VKLLLVDDSKAIRLANQRALEQVGYEVWCAEDGEGRAENCTGST